MEEEIPYETQNKTYPDIHMYIEQYDQTFIYEFTVKSSKNITYRCKAQSRSCKGRLYIPEHLDFNKIISDQNYLKENQNQIIYSHHENHYRYDRLQVKPNDKIYLKCKDENILQKFIEENFYLSPEKIKNLLYQQGYVFSLEKCKKYRDDYLNIKNPKSQELVWIKQTTNLLETNENDQDSDSLVKCQEKLPSFSKKGDDQFIILASIWQLHLLQQCEILHIDGTFKTCPPQFQQLIIIVAEINYQIIPLCWILMTSKSQTLYEHVFLRLKSLVKLYSRKKMLVKTIFTDFEVGMRNALQFVWQKANLQGCYFHFVKALWNKANQISLRNKKHIQITKIIIGYLKLVVHMPLDFRQVFFQALKLKINQMQFEPLTKLITYFEKNWLQKYLVNQDLVQNFLRTNNNSEIHNSRHNRDFNWKQGKPSQFHLKEFLLKQELKYRIIVLERKIPLNYKLNFRLTKNIKEINYDIEDKETFLMNYIIDGFTNLGKKIDNCLNNIEKQQLLIQSLEDTEIQNQLNQQQEKILEVIFPNNENQNQVDDDNNQDLSNYDFT